MLTATTQRIEELETTTQELIDYVGQFSAEQQSHKPDETSWSLLQIVDHLVATEAGIGSFFKKYPPSESEHKSTMMGKAKVQTLFLALKSPKRFKAPDYLSSPNGDQTIATYKAAWATAREFITTCANNMPTNKQNYTVMKHPVSGPITMDQCLRFITLHIEHHRHQMNRLVASQGFSKLTVKQD